MQPKVDGEIERLRVDKVVKVSKDIIKVREVNQSVAGIYKKQLFWVEWESGRR